MKFVIAKALDEIEAITADAHDLLDPLNDEQFNWRPEAKRWSIGQCIGHLNLVGEMFDTAFKETLARAREEGLTGSGPYPPGPLGSFFLWVMEPPVRMGVKAPENALPRERVDLETARALFFEIQERWLETYKRADGVNLRKAKLHSPLRGTLALSMSAWLPAMVSHERRHLWQARQVRQRPGFPA